MSNQQWCMQILKYLERLGGLSKSAFLPINPGRDILKIQMCTTRMRYSKLVSSWIPEKWLLGDNWGPSRFRSFWFNIAWMESFTGILDQLNWFLKVYKMSLKLFQVPFKKIIFYPFHKLLSLQPAKHSTQMWENWRCKAQ